MDCRCGHPKHEHQHYRRGTDCARCSCVKYQWRWLSFFSEPARTKPKAKPHPRPISLLKAAIGSFAKHRR